MFVLFALSSLCLSISAQPFLCLLTKDRSRGPTPVHIGLETRIPTPNVLLVEVLATVESSPRTLVTSVRMPPQQLGNGLSRQISERKRRKNMGRDPMALVESPLENLPLRSQLRGMSHSLLSS